MEIIVFFRDKTAGAGNRICNYILYFESERTQDHYNIKSNALGTEPVSPSRSPRALYPVERI